jgi:hypothetical protein
LILLAKHIYFLNDWLSSLRSVVSFLINWSAAELTNSNERESAFVTKKKGKKSCEAWPYREAQLKSKAMLRRKFYGKDPEDLRTRTVIWNDPKFQISLYATYFKGFCIFALPES